MEGNENKHNLKKILSGIVWLFLTLVGCAIVIYALIGMIAMLLLGALLGGLVSSNVSYNILFLSIGVTEITVGYLLKRSVIKKPTKKGYEKLVDAYTSIYGADEKRKLDSKIEEFINQGLTQEEAIKKVEMVLKKYQFNDMVK